MHIFPLHDLGKSVNFSGPCIKAFNTRKCYRLSALTDESSNRSSRKIRNINRCTHFCGTLTLQFPTEINAFQLAKTK